MRISVAIAAILFAAILAEKIVVEGKPTTEYDYPSDNYDYDESEPLNEEEEETEFLEDISFRNRGTTQVFDKGTTITLKCLVDNYPNDLVIMWRKVEEDRKTEGVDFLVIGNQVVRQNGRITVNNQRSGNEIGSNLIIALADDTDAGQYVCQLGTKDKKELKHTVKVREPPTILKTPSNGLFKANKGEDVTLSCIGSGNPQPTITWTREHKKLPDGRDKLEATELTFKSVSRKHSGTYICIADNGYGQPKKERIHLEVEYEPEVEVEEYFIHATEDNKVELVCMVHAHPQATVQWFKNDLELTDDDATLERIGHKYTLTIPSLSHSDYGNYTCRAKNVLGEKSKILEVSGLAGFADFKSEARGQEANSFLLEWTSESKTPVEEFELTWREEGGQWEGFTVEAHPINDFNYAGKYGFSKLNSATRYEARVMAKNAEGWSRPSKSFHFATFGAEPLTETGSATISNSHQFVIALLVILIAKFL